MTLFSDPLERRECDRAQCCGRVHAKGLHPLPFVRFRFGQNGDVLQSPPFMNLYPIPTPKQESHKGSSQHVGHPGWAPKWNQGIDTLHVFNPKALDSVETSQDPTGWRSSASDHLLELLGLAPSPQGEISVSFKKTVVIQEANNWRKPTTRPPQKENAPRP